jgi:hypothetical protein
LTGEYLLAQSKKGPATAWASWRPTEREPALVPGQSQ